MSDYQMGAIESRFADVIWQNEPVTAAELAKKSEALLGWKKTTSYTVLKRLCEKGIFQNDKGIVTSRLSRGDFYARRCETFVDETFGGSLPAFLAAFTARKQLTDEEAAYLRRLVDRHDERKE